MKNYLILAMITGVVLLSSCNFNRPTPIAESHEEPASSSETESSQGESPHQILVQESALPQNIPEHQLLVDRYFQPYYVTGLFMREFGPQNMEDLGDSLMPLFEVICAQENLDMEPYQGVLPAHVVEDVLMSRFDVEPELIRRHSSRWYDSTKNVYNYSGGLGGGPQWYYILESTDIGNTKTITYELYQLMEESGDNFLFGCLQEGELVIETDQDSFKFISNSVMRQDEKDG